MPTFEARRIHRETGKEYRYEAKYWDQGDYASWSAVVSVFGETSVRLAGTVRFDPETTPAFSAVAKVVNAHVDAGNLAQMTS